MTSRKLLAPRRRKGGEVKLIDQVLNKPAVLPSLLFWWALYLAGVIGMGVLAYAARIHDHFPGDVPVVIWFQDFGGGGWVNTMEVVSYLGNVYVFGPLLGAGILALWVAGKRTEFVFFLGAFGLQKLATFAFKEIVNRPRPDGELIQVLESASSPSFPSGHVVAFVVCLGFLLYLITTNVRHLGIRWLSAVILGFSILAVGPSRCTLGAHWPSDVLSGYLLGGLLLVAVITGYRFASQRQLRFLARRT